jgi:hypothetical protein
LLTQKQQYYFFIHEILWKRSSQQVRKENHIFVKGELILLNLSAKTKDSLRFFLIKLRCKTLTGFQKIFVLSESIDKKVKKLFFLMKEGQLNFFQTRNLF